MFSREQILQSAVFAAIVVVLKLLETEGAYTLQGSLVFVCVIFRFVTQALALGGGGGGRLPIAMGRKSLALIDWGSRCLPTKKE